MISVVIDNVNSKAHVGDFVAVESDGNPHFFAYVTNIRFTSE